MKLEEDELWKKTKALAGFISTLLPDLSEDVKWTISSKLRNRSFDLTSDVSEAIGSVDPRDKTYYYALARRNAFGLKNALIIAEQANDLDPEPELIVLLEAIINEVDEAIHNANKAIPGYLNKFSIEGKK